MNDGIPSFLWILRHRNLHLLVVDLGDIVLVLFIGIDHLRVMFVKGWRSVLLVHEFGILLAYGPLKWCHLSPDLPHPFVFLLGSLLLELVLFAIGREDLLAQTTNKIPPMIYLLLPLSPHWTGGCTGWCSRPYPSTLRSMPGSSSSGRGSPPSNSMGQSIIYCGASCWLVFRTQSPPRRTTHLHPPPSTTLLNHSPTSWIVVRYHGSAVKVPINY